MNPQGQKTDANTVSAEIAHSNVLPNKPQNATVNNPSIESTFTLRKTAHDLRNALNIIRNAAYLLRRKLVAGGGENVDLVDMIEESVKSAEIMATEMMDQAARTSEPSPSRSAPQAK